MFFNHRAASFLPDFGRRLAVGALIACAVPAISFAQDPYPDKPIHFIVNQPAGGTGDTVVRIVSQRLAVRLGKPVVVDNRPGAGGTLGAMLAAKAAPDGYTLVLGSPTLATVETMYPKLSFNPAKELVPVAMMGMLPNALVVRAESPFKSVADVVSYAKAHPGKLTYGSAGNGTQSHLIGSLFASETKISALHVPYGGTAPALTALLGGQVDIYFDPMSSAEMMKAGRVRALATSGEKRTSLLSQVPTLIEQGYKISGSTWLGIMAPAGTPKPIIERLNREVDAILREPEVKQEIEKRLVSPDPMTVDQFNAFFARETQVWNAVVRSAGIKIE